MPPLDALSDLLIRAAQTAGATARPIAVKEILDTTRRIGRCARTPSSIRTTITSSW